MMFQRVKLKVASTKQIGKVPDQVFYIVFKEPQEIELLLRDNEGEVNILSLWIRHGTHAHNEAVKTPIVATNHGAQSKTKW